uniref:7TM_GPCR_Srx domain-containing protein n=1 Tax=Caenorhabditis tropicalis TaxID=1561998 RepID=A0A1I7U2I6_9PELO
MPSSPLTIYSRITSSVAIINNLLLILLILFKSHPEVGKYKILMIYISIFEILYAILDAVGAPVASVAIIFIFGYKCYVETKKLIDPTSQSAFFNKLQSQLFYALVFQTLIPVVLMHIPASIGFITSFFNMSIEVFGNILFSTICLYPVLDPLPNFFIIKNYRDAIWS